MELQVTGHDPLVVAEGSDVDCRLPPHGRPRGRWRRPVLTLAQLKQKMRDSATAPTAEFVTLKKKKDIARALPRLVVAATLTEDFGYSQRVLTERELGVGLIIEAGLRPRPVK